MAGLDLTPNSATFMFCFTLLVIVTSLRGVRGFSEARRLYENLMEGRDYNQLIRPVDNHSQQLTVYLGLKLAQLIDVDEKNQIITTNVWVEQEWIDSNLMWDPKDYSGVTKLYLPSDKLWLPDIVLYNNADGNYELVIMTKATVFYNGTVRWMPPAVYKSSCNINVEFFPFDEQICSMKFGSWTYDGLKVNLKHILQKSKQTKNKTGKVMIDYAVDLTEYYPNGEFDVLKLAAIREDFRYPCCPEPFPDVTFNITLRRKTLFYTVNLIIPCVAISFLTVLVFYLPSESGEKISLSISILLSLTVFFLLLAEIIPPTSMVVPLIGKYLLFTMILVTLSIVVTVIVLNVHFRGPDTHEMAPWVRTIFLNILPRLLCMRRPNENDDSEYEQSVESSADNDQMMRALQTPVWDWGFQIEEKPFNNDIMSHSGSRRVLCRQGTSSFDDCDLPDEANAFLPPPPSYMNATTPNVAHDNKNSNHRSASEFKKKIKDAIAGVRMIAEHLRQEDVDQSVREDWKYVAMVLDRMFLWIFTTACIIGSCGIILQAPALYDNSIAMTSQNVPTKANLFFFDEKKTDKIDMKFTIDV